MAGRKRNIVDVLEETQALQRRRRVSRARPSRAKREAVAQKDPALAYTAYAKVLGSYAKKVEALIAEHLVPTLGDSTRVERGLRNLADQLDALPFKYLRNIEAAGKRAATHAQNEVRRMFGVALPTGGADDTVLLDGFVRGNLDALRKVGRDQIAEIRKALEKGGDAEQLREAVLHKAWVARNRGKMVARDQVFRYSQQEVKRWALTMGSEGGIYLTRRDERVRPTHAALDGQFFRWDSPPSTLHEPQCRCKLVPVEAVLLSE